VDRRYRKYRNMGKVGGAWRDAVRSVQDMLSAADERRHRRTSL
jgi:hypothetical protein